MDAIAIIDKYYPENNELKHILLTHSRSVADKALWIAERHPELSLDRQFLEEAALLHDIGIFMTDADGIHCYGTHPYICHGYLGSELLQREGYPVMPWCANGIREPAFRLKVLSAKTCRYPIVRWCQSRWRSKWSVSPTSSFPRLI